MLSRLVEHISEAAFLETQCGFRETQSTTDMVFILRQLMEKSRKQRKDLHIAFIDLSKAFNTINCEILWRQFSKLGVPPKFISILQQLRDEMQDRILTGRVHQGECCCEARLCLGEARLCLGAGVIHSIYSLPSPTSSTGTQRQCSLRIPSQWKLFQHLVPPGSHKNEGLPNL